tara:strand:+ start:6751 stop:7149 length:399 start_codon:yes stop_codon:yes gene_type:complete
MNKGYVLATTLFVAAFIISLGTLVYSFASDGEKISHNIRAYTRAKTTAESGIQHFRTLDVHYEDLQLMGAVNGEEFVLIEGSTSERDVYRVTAVLQGNDIFYIYSRGDYLRNGRVLASAEVAASFQSLWLQK